MNYYKEEKAMGIFDFEVMDGNGELVSLEKYRGR